MYKWSKKLKYPIIHFAMLQDLLRNPQDTEEFFAELNEILDIAFTKDPNKFQEKDPMSGDTLLMAALGAGLFEVARKVGKMVKQEM